MSERGGFGRWVSGILATVIGGILVALILGDGLPGGGNGDEIQEPRSPAVEDDQRAVTDEPEPPPTMQYLVSPTQVTAGWAWLDLDTGRLDATPGDDLATFELGWVCGADDMEGLRLENVDQGSAWAPFHVTGSVDEVAIDDLQSAGYLTSPHPETGYTDLFFEHKSNSPVVGTTFLVRTADANYSAVRIAGYAEADPGVCREFTVEYFTWAP